MTIARPLRTSLTLMLSCALAAPIAGGATEGSRYAPTAPHRASLRTPGDTRPTIDPSAAPGHAAGAQVGANVERDARAPREARGVGAQLGLGRSATTVPADEVAIVPDSGRRRQAFGPTARPLGASAPAGAPSARGGGPQAGALAVADALRSEDPPADRADDDAGDSSRSFPLALGSECTRVSVVATPAVRDVSLRIVDPDGNVSRHDAQRGRTERAVVCPNRTGEHRIEARLVPAGRGGVIGAEVFSDATDQRVVAEPLRLTR